MFSTQKLPPGCEVEVTLIHLFLQSHSQSKLWFKSLYQEAGGETETISGHSLKQTKKAIISLSAGKQTKNMHTKNCLESPLFHLRQISSVVLSQQKVYKETNEKCFFSVIWDSWSCSSGCSICWKLIKLLHLQTELNPLAAVPLYCVEMAKTSSLNPECHIRAPCSPVHTNIMLAQLIIFALAKPSHCITTGTYLTFMLAQMSTSSNRKTFLSFDFRTCPRSPYTVSISVSQRTSDPCSEFSC